MDYFAKTYLLTFYSLSQKAVKMETTCTKETNLGNFKKAIFKISRAEVFMSL